MAKIRSLRLVGPNELEIVDVDEPIVDDCSKQVVHVRYAGLNRRDYWIYRGLYPGIHYPCTLGSDAVGECQGKRVILNPGLNWVKRSAVQPQEFEILGMPLDGTFTEKVVIDKQNIFECPEHLSDQEASCLGLGGLTAYRALFTRGRLHSGETVLITGIGGGVAAIAMQFCLAIGCQVWVTSGSMEKIEKAIECGASGGFSYRDSNYLRKLGMSVGGFDMVLDSAMGSSLSGIEEIMNPGGRIVFYGGTNGDVPVLNSRMFFWKQLSLLGTTMGSQQEFTAMLDFVNSHRVRPIVSEVLSLEQYDYGFGLMRDHTHFGKIVFNTLV